MSYHDLKNNELKKLREKTKQEKMPLVRFIYPATETTYYNNAVSAIYNYNFDHEGGPQIDPAPFIKKPGEEKIYIDTAAVNLTTLGLNKYPGKVYDLITDFYLQTGIMCSQVKHHVEHVSGAPKGLEDSLLVCHGNEQEKEKFLGNLLAKNILSISDINSMEISDDEKNAILFAGQNFSRQKP